MAKPGLPAKYMTKKEIDIFDRLKDLYKNNPSESSHKTLQNFALSMIELDKTRKLRDTTDAFKAIF